VRALIVTAATGQGHVTAAGALAEALTDAGAQAKVLDAGENGAVRTGASLYNFFLRRPPSWMPVFYAGIEWFRVSDVAGRALRSWAAEVLERERPDIIVSVHPTVNQGVAGMLARESPRLPFAVVLTDLCPPFWRGWSEPRAALTTAPTESAAGELARWGTPRERIEVLGMPVAARFRRRATEPERRAARVELGLEADRFTLLINAGTAERATSVEVLEALGTASDLSGSIQVLFLAGRSAELARRAGAVRAAFPTRVLGWRGDVDRLLDAADAVFAKPGALTVAEALGKGVPLLLDAVHGVFPQERGGARWAAGENLAWLVGRPEQVARILRETPREEWLRRRELCAKALPGGAAEIGRRVLALA